MKILVTGFDPFGGEATNPAYEAIKLLPDTIDGAEIIKLEIPTVFGKGAQKAIEMIEEKEVDVVVSVGQAGSRSAMTVEKVAINLVEARIPDNEGQQPFDLKIKEDGENAYFTTLPIKAMVEEMKANGIPAFVSYTAGTYVCNEVMYQELYAVNKRFPSVRAGFVHVPYAAAQAVDKPNGTPFMSIETIAKGLEFGLKAIVANEEDKSIIMGETH